MSCAKKIEDEDMYEIVSEQKKELEIEEIDTTEEKAIPAIPIIPAVPEEFDLSIFIANWAMEIGFVSFILLFVIWYYFGKKRNERIVLWWYEAAKELLGANFASVGDGAPIRKETETLFFCYCSGRINVDGMLITLELLPRHNLVMFVYAVLTGQKDTMLIEAFTDSNKKIPNILLALLNKKDKAYKKDDKSLKRFTTLVPYPSQMGVAGGKAGANLSTAYTVCAESDDVGATLAGNDYINKFLASTHPFLRIIHVTDSYESWGFKNAVIVKTDVPLPANTSLSSDECVEHVGACLRFSLYLIDTALPTLQFSAIAEKRAKNRLKLLEDEARKQERKEREEKMQVW